MLSNDLNSILYYLDEHNGLDEGMTDVDVANLYVRIENCMNQAKQLENVVMPNNATLDPSTLKGNVVPLLIGRRHIPTPLDDDGGVA